MEQLGITVFDVAVIAVAVFGALIGMSSGFAHAVLFIASWIGAGWVAWRYANLIKPEIEQLVGSTDTGSGSASVPTPDPVPSPADPPKPPPDPPKPPQ